MGVYKKYGEVFRGLREQNNISMSSFGILGISKATLSNFELGKSMMGFDKVLCALEFMGISLEEFEYFLNNYSENEAKSIINDIEKATFQQDNSLLLKLYTNACESKLLIIALAVKSSCIGLSKEEISKMLDFFYHIDMWGEKELWLFYTVIDNFDTYDILLILEELTRDKNKLLNLEKYSRRFILVCCKAATVLITRGYREYSEHILNRMIMFDHVVTMFQHNVYNFTIGLWEYKFEDKELGQNLVEASLKVFKELALPEVFNYYENEFKSLKRSKDI